AYIGQSVSKKAARYQLEGHQIFGSAPTMLRDLFGSSPRLLRPIFGSRSASLRLRFGSESKPTRSSPEQQSNEAGGSTGASPNLSRTIPDPYPKPARMRSASYPTPTLAFADLFLQIFEIVVVAIAKYTGQ